MNLSLDGDVTTILRISSDRWRKAIRRCDRGPGLPLRSRKVAKSASLSCRKLNGENTSLPSKMWSAQFGRQSQNITRSRSIRSPSFEQEASRRRTVERSNDVNIV